jgi:hypothetical protein
VPLPALILGAALCCYWASSRPTEIAPADPSRLETLFRHVRSLPGPDDAPPGRTLYLDAENGDDRWDGMAPQPADVPHGPWKTLTRANSQVRAGDTVLISAGNYDETIRPERSGTAEAWISYVARPQASVVLTRPVELAGRSFVALRGLRFHSADGTAWLRTDERTHHVGIQQCLFDCAASRFKEFTGLHLEGHHFTLRQSVFGRGMGDQIHAPRVTHLLIEDNDFSQAAADHALIAAVGENVVIRGNYFRNPWARVLHLCWNKERPMRRVLVENNLFVDCDWNRTGPHPIPNQADRGSAETVRFLATEGVFRNNLLIGCNPGNDWPIHAVLSFQTFHSRWYETTHYERLRLYHNTLYGNRTTAVIFTRNTDELHLEDLVFQNNVIADSAGPAFRVDTDAIPWQGYRFRSNLLVDAHGSGVISLPEAAEGALTVAAAQARFPKVFRGNIDRAPHFRDVALLKGAVEHPDRFGLRDLPQFWEAFTLEEGTPGQGTASPLTAVAEAGAGTTTVRVDDALFFCDGLGMSGGDVVSLGDAGEAVVRRVIDEYSLELDRPVTVRRGDPVSVKWAGRERDMGIAR